MTRKAIHTATNMASRRGIDQPGSIPSSQFRKGLRQRAGEISGRAAMSENVRSTGTEPLKRNEPIGSNLSVALESNYKSTLLTQVHNGPALPPPLSPLPLPRCTQR